MTHSAGAHEGITAEIVDDSTGIVEIAYGTGAVHIECQRNGPCKWTAVKKRLNNEVIQTDKLSMADDYVGALEEAYQVWKHGGPDGIREPAAP